MPNPRFKGLPRRIGPPFSASPGIPCVRPAACERIGHWQGAEEHFLEFQARGVLPNTVAYNRLISALGRGGQWERALAAFQAMQGGTEGGGSSSSTGDVGSNGSAPASSSSSSTLSANGSAAAGKAGPAARSPSSSSQPAARAASPPAGSDSDGAGEANAAAVYAGSAPAKPDRITYGSLISALERGGQWERALAVYEDMLAAGIQVGLWVGGFVGAC